ncbi:MAG: ABC transporter permease [Epulopiscium sp.]|nr:ABC transporter permease [Candidatus Epulonipiscium sp.]
MRISNIAIKNIKGNLYRYIMYYLSNSFAVSVFFIFASFVFHPVIKSDIDSGKSAIYAGVVSGMIACQVIIVAFSILFVIFSTSIFLKSRGKEFGLLSLFGMTKDQIKVYLVIENTIMGILSLVTGIGVGMLFSKLFFMIMGSFLGIMIPFHISFKALGITVLVFFILFEVIGVFMSLGIRNKDIVDQLKASQMPKDIPRFSKIKAILGVLLLLAGYIIAWNVHGVGVITAMLPVILIVVIGTYFVFTQFSIAMASQLCKNKKIFYNQVNMVAFSQMIFKLQDTARVLFLAAILGAVTFTATETIYSFFVEVPKMGTAQDIAIIERNENLENPFNEEEIKKILLEHDLEIKSWDEVTMVQQKGVKNQGHEEEEETFLLISNSHLNQLMHSLGKKSIQVRRNEAIYNYQFDTIGLSHEEEKEELFFIKDGKEKKFEVTDRIYETTTYFQSMGCGRLVVLHDQDFDWFLENASQEQRIQYTAINIKNWRQSFYAVNEIKDRLGEAYQGFYFSKIVPYRAARISFGMILFIGFFIAFLFFIAAGSIIYFKLFNEVTQDAMEYSILTKIGTTKQEIKKIITKQIGILFFLPFFVSTVHSFFALKSLSNLLKKNLFKEGLIVMVAYLIFQVIYFSIIKILYINKVESIKR